MVWFGGELDGVAVSGALPGIQRVLGSVISGVLKFLEDVCDVSGNGDVACSGLVVSFQVEAEVELVTPV